MGHTIGSYRYSIFIKICPRNLVFEGLKTRLFHTIHGGIANLLKLLIAIHVLAALKHQFIDKLAFLKRMA